MKYYIVFCIIKVFWEKKLYGYTNRTFYEFLKYQFFADIFGFTWFATKFKSAYACTISFYADLFWRILFEQLGE